MQRKPGFPVANCSIKMPDGMPLTEPAALEEDSDQAHRRQQLINFGHAQWGFNNWSWSVTKQDLDFVDFANGKYTAGVVAFVLVTVKSLDIHRENIGYATTVASNKGSAIYRSRKCAVTNALRETLLSFGGNVATELTEQLEPTKSEYSTPAPEPENNLNAPNAPNAPNAKSEVKNVKSMRKECSDVNSVNSVVSNVSCVNSLVSKRPPPVKNSPVAPPPPVAKALPMPAPRPLTAPRPPPPRPNSNEPRPLESMSEEEARAERKRRQQRAQEEFKLKQMLKAKETDVQQDLQKSSTSFDKLLMDIPTQDIDIEQTGEEQDQGKRKSPAPETSTKRRASAINRLDIVTD